MYKLFIVQWIRCPFSYQTYIMKQERNGTGYGLSTVRPFIRYVHLNGGGRLHVSTPASALMQTRALRLWTELSRDADTQADSKTI